MKGKTKLYMAHEKYTKDCVPWDGSHTGVGKQYEEESLAVVKCY